VILFAIASLIAFAVFQHMIMNDRYGTEVQVSRLWWQSG
jgi:hypothetical protein